MADKISITICGDGGCGKSSITLRLVRSQWTHDYDPTIEDSYSVTRTVDGLPYHLSLTDTAGQEEYRSLWAASNLSSDAFLLVYDITNPNSLDALSYFTDMIEIETENRQEQNARLLNERRPRRDQLRAPPVKIVAGNKCDLKDARVVSARQGLEWARARECGFMETSAREMVNVEETFALIVSRVVEARRLQAHPATNAPRSLNLGGLNSYQNHGQGPGAKPLQIQAQQPQSPAPVMTEKSRFEADDDRIRDEERWQKPWWKRWLTCGCFGR